MGGGGDGGDWVDGDALISRESCGRVRYGSDESIVVSRCM